MDDRPGADLVRSWKDPDFRDADAVHPSGAIFMDEAGGSAPATPTTLTIATSIPCATVILAVTAAGSCNPVCDHTYWSGGCQLGTLGTCPA